MKKNGFKEATVGYLLRGSGRRTKTLLGLRDSLFCNNIWNGPGGKMRSRETVASSLRRELREEIGVTVDLASVRHFATADFYCPNGGSYQHSWRVHYLTVGNWEGEPQPIQGFQKLGWFPLYRLPHNQMMSDQVAWLPLAISNTNGHLLNVNIFYGDEGSSTIARGDFQFVERPA